MSPEDAQAPERSYEPLDELQKTQEAYDANYWELNDPAREKLGHVNAHGLKTLGKIAAVFERHAHDVRRMGETGGEIPLRNAEVLWEEAAPDLCMHALQVTNARGMKLGALYRSEFGKSEVGPSTLRDLQDAQAAYDERSWAVKSVKDKLEEIVLDLEETLGAFARWLKGDESALPNEIVLGLMRGALRITNLGGQDLDTLYHARLAQNIEQLQGRVS